MKMTKIYIIYALATLILFADFVVAFPPIPEAYAGKAYMNGEIAPINTSITLKSASGYGFKTTVVTNSGDYSMDVILDDTDTSAVEGAREGEALTWYLDGKEVTSCNRISPCRDTAKSGEVNPNFDIAVGNIPVTTTVKGIQSTEEKKTSVSQKTETKGFSWLLILVLLIILMIIIIIVAVVAFLLLRGKGKKSALGRK